MTEMAIVFALAGAAGILGAAIGVRDLKRKTVITIERGKPRLEPGDEALALDSFGKPPQANFRL